MVKAKQELHTVMHAVKLELLRRLLLHQLHTVHRQGRPPWQPHRHMEANMELHSVNQELHLANQELHLANQELHLANQEMCTVELQEVRMAKELHSVKLESLRMVKLAMHMVELHGDNQELPLAKVEMHVQWALRLSL